MRCESVGRTQGGRFGRRAVFRCAMHRWPLCGLFGRPPELPQGLLSGNGPRTVVCAGAKNPRHNCSKCAEWVADYRLALLTCNAFYIKICGARHLQVGEGCIRSASAEGLPKGQSLVVHCVFNQRLVSLCAFPCPVHQSRMVFRVCPVRMGNRVAECADRVIGQILRALPKGCSRFRGSSEFVEARFARIALIDLDQKYAHFP